MSIHNIAIIGFGEVGSSIGALLNATYKDITFNLFDFEDEISGRILDFEHACVIQSNKVTVNDRSGVKEADFIIYTAGYSNKPGESRYSVAQKNKALISSIFTDLQVKKEAIVIVITNPVEPATFWVHEVIKGACTVVGTGTSLDTFRLQYILSKHFNCEPREVETMVIGEHGEHMVPLFSQTKIKGVPVRSIANEELLTIIRHELIHSATSIRKTEKATKFGIAATCLKVVKSFVDSTLNIPLSVVIEPDQLSSVKHTDAIAISWPVKWENKKMILSNIDLTEEETATLMEANESIKSSIRLL